MARNICIILFMVCIAGCTEKPGDAKQPVHLPGIPSDAFWSGRNGTAGHWFKIHSVHDHKNSAFISIYDAVMGELIVKKKFHLICPGNDQSFIEDLEKQIDRWEDGKIYLKAGAERSNCYLL